ncbi:MAG: Abi family protein [Dysgonamonadaceae bacterium]|jgi:abortive infection bacteriophage resistance protein|nr:Abi family protein [Fermentimonas sp.]MDD3901917.1 Abi family protein [Dysgonamonadaceae bacterium]
MRNPTKHYVKNKNHVPPWILFKNANFSDCINFYSFLKPTEKDAMYDTIVNIKFDDGQSKKDTFFKSLIIVRKFRNVIAHNLKFITFKCSKKESLILKYLLPAFSGSLIKSSDLQHKRSLNDIYSMILSIIILLHDELLIVEFLNELIDFAQITSKNSSGIDMSPFVNRYLNITNLPLDLSKRLGVYRNSIISKDDIEQ